MKIAQIAPCWLSVPPKGYGGIEAMIALLCDGLVERGHDVTLFASGGSETKAKLVSRYEEPPGMEAVVSNPFLDLPHVLDAYDVASEFDVVHDHTFPLGPAIGAQLQHPPVVHTVHGPPDDPRARPMYEKLGRRINLVAISNYQRHSVEGLNYVATIYNGIDVDAHPFRAEKEDYLLFLGRFTNDKGVHLAVEAARRLGRRLLVAGKMEEPAEKEYFENEVRPRLTEDIEVLGQASGTDKLELYANAACLLMPIQWPEPFGLVMVEALACGTPVVAMRNGSVPELIDHGVTGFVVDDLDSLVECVAQVHSIDPAACRQAAESRFSKLVMVEAYEKVYADLAG